MTRRSVLVTEAKGDGTVLGKFISDRLAHTMRLYTEKETMQLVFKAFNFILQVQMHHLEQEGALLADLHENNITVMSDGEGGPLDVQFAFVDASGLLTVKGPKRARKDPYQSPFVVFLEYLVNCQSRQGPQESLVCLCDAGLGQDAKDRRRIQPRVSPRLWLDARANLARACKGMWMTHRRGFWLV